MTEPDSMAVTEFLMASGSKSPSTADSVVGVGFDIDLAEAEGVANGREETPMRDAVGRCTAVAVRRWGNRTVDSDDAGAARAASSSAAAGPILEGSMVKLCGGGAIVCAPVGAVGRPKR